MKHDNVFTTSWQSVVPDDDIYTIVPDSNNFIGQLLPISLNGIVSQHCWETGDWLAAKAFKPEMLEACIRDKRLVYIGKVEATGGINVAVNYRPEIRKFSDGRSISMRDPFFWPLLRELAEKELKK